MSALGLVSHLDCIFVLLGVAVKNFTISNGAEWYEQFFTGQWTKSGFDLAWFSCLLSACLYLRCYTC